MRGKTAFAAPASFRERALRIHFNSARERVLALAIAVPACTLPAAAQTFDWDTSVPRLGALTGVRQLVSFQPCGTGQTQPHAGGSRWNEFDWTPVGSNPVGVARALAVVDFGAGAQLIAAASSNGGLYSWNGIAWSALPVGGSTSAILVRDEGGSPVLYGAGAYGASAPFQRVMRFDGTTATTLSPFATGTVSALADFDDGSGRALYAAGNFLYIGTSDIVRWNGSTWSALPSIPTVVASDEIRALFVHDDGSGPALYAGGRMPSNLQRWNGSTWTPVGGGVDGTVLALAEFADGPGPPKLFVGGNFANAGGVPADDLACWDGTSWSAVGTSFTASGVVGLSAVDDANGRALYAAGSNLRTGGTLLGSVARYRATGTSPGTAFCFGDGSLANDCPCAQPDLVPVPSGDPDAGCANLPFLGGAKLTAVGRLQPDEIELRAWRTPNSFTQFIAGDGVDESGIASGDGLRCASGSLVRFGGQTLGCDALARYPRPDLGLTTPLSIVSGTSAGSGATRYYQLLYRNNYPGFCTSGTTNLTNAFRITWN